MGGWMMRPSSETYGGLALPLFAFGRKVLSYLKQVQALGPLSEISHSSFLSPSL